MSRTLPRPVIEGKRIRVIRVAAMKHQPRPIRPWAVAVLLVAVGSIAGCGHKDRFDVTGRVTFAGQPVPAGTVTFIPVGSSPPGRVVGFCQIRAGLFATREGRSPGSGPHRVFFNGCDGVPYESRLGDTVLQHPMGEELFPSHMVEIDVPAKSGFVLDVDVPQASQRPKSVR